ncbi:hypothetical protein F5877DRAFT_65677 [Lentinula edodes]|nr:hypothetical protein F5877DRAFT_65677 [Lentinula edodes]
MMSVLEKAAKIYQPLQWTADGTPSVVLHPTEVPNIELFYIQLSIYYLTDYETRALKRAITHTHSHKKLPYHTDVIVIKHAECIALEGEDNWWPYKREVSLAVESKGLQGYLHGTIAKPSEAKPAVTVTSPEGTTTTPHQTPSPEEWYTQDRYVASTIVSNIIDPTGLGVDYTEIASVIWRELVNQFEQKSEELLLFHDSNLRAHRYAYPEETIEEHKRTMRNLLRRATNAGAVITDGQFQVIVLASLPKDWDANIRHLPGKMSSEAFIYN